MSKAAVAWFNNVNEKMNNHLHTRGVGLGNIQNDIALGGVLAGFTVEEWQNMAQNLVINPNTVPGIEDELDLTLNTSKEHFENISGMDYNKLLSPTQEIGKTNLR